MNPKIPFKRWLYGLPLHDRRRSERRAVPGLVSYYWDGGPSLARDVREISSTGLFLVTDQRWYPGTLVTMTIQNAGNAEAGANNSIVVQAKVVRLDTEGVGLEFAFPLRNSRRKTSTVTSTANEKALSRFLHQSGSGSMLNERG
jgi:hypothetical protein